MSECAVKSVGSEVREIMIAGREVKVGRVYRHLKQKYRFELMEIKSKKGE